MAEDVATSMRDCLIHDEMHGLVWAIDLGDGGLMKNHNLEPKKQMNGTYRIACPSTWQSSCVSTT